MLSRLLSGYESVEGRYDELLSAPATPRAHWEEFLASLASREGMEVSETLTLMEREIRENGVTYNVYADPKGADRPWDVDPLPLLLSPASPSHKAPSPPPFTSMIRSHYIHPSLDLQRVVITTLMYSSST